MKVAITGARSYSGKYIALRLLARGDEVVTLTGHPNRPDPFGGRVRLLPLDFDDPRELRNALAGCDVLVNTYWIRFDRGANTQAHAVRNTGLLIRAAEQAGVKRVVHLSVTNPSLESPLPYYRGKAETDRAVSESTMSYAILRPNLFFGPEDILINNIAFMLRRFPVFFIAGDGRYRLQPIFVEDLAELVVRAVDARENNVSDAVGPETLAFRDMVDLIGRMIGHRRPFISVSPGVLHLTARVLGSAFGDTILTRHEITGLMSGLLVSSQPPRGTTRLSDWLFANRTTIGRAYRSEIERHYLRP